MVRYFLLLILYLYSTGISSQESPMSFIPEWAPFYHGVASGDPLEDRVVIWTRVTPEAAGNQSIEVSWQVASDVNLENVVASGTYTTDESRDFTVKVDVMGLQAATTYYYVFSAFGKNSLVGKTKTTPTDDQVDHLKFGVVSCSNYQAGYFNAYQKLAERTDLDAVIHLGDYIYEYANGIYGDSALFAVRLLEPVGEAISLADYRTRYSTYRLDTSLIRIHQQHPFITVWDDHESANDSYTDGAQNHDENTEGEWETRKAAAKQAYFEWIPIRENEDQQVYRKISYGQLMDLILLDTRLEGREEQLVSARDSSLFDTSRTLLGREQKNWLFNQLANSSARWKVIGQQVLFSELNVGFAALQDNSLDYYGFESLFLDIWDGYPAERSQIIQFLIDNQIDNTVILTGDFHTALAFDVVDHPVDITFRETPFVGEAAYYSPANYDPATGEGAVAVEFATPSVTSANFDERFDSETTQTLQNLINEDIIVSILDFGNPNPHMKYVNLAQHGYYILDVKADSVQADWFFTPIDSISSVEEFGEGWYSRDGANRLLPALAHSEPKQVQDIPAPRDPLGEINSPSDVPEKIKDDFVLLGLYPNPSRRQNTLHYSLTQPAQLRIDLFNQAGQLVETVVDQRIPAGIFTQRVDTEQLPAGIYFYNIRINDRLFTAKMIKVR